MITHQIPTPAYIYDLDEIRRCYHLLHSFLPRPSTIFYSVKANPHPAVVNALRERGCYTEVASTGELAAALQSGVRAHDQVLYTAPGKRDADLTEALEHGVRLFSIDSPYAIEQLDRLAAARRAISSFLLRVDDTQMPSGGRLAMSGDGSQFGADLDLIRTHPHLFADRPNAHLAGLHFFGGSQVTNSEDLIAQAANAIRTAAQLQRTIGKRLNTLNLGGGFPAPYAEPGAVAPLKDFGPQIAAHLDASFAGWRSGTPRIVFESGRYLTATCGQFVLRVLEVKQSGGRNIAVLEAGINHLGGMSGLRRLPALYATVSLGRQQEPAIDYRLVGPLCTPLDTLSASANLPPLHPGDELTIPNVGAYGLTASLVAFLSHPLPHEVIVEDGEIKHISTLAISRQQNGRPDDGRRIH